MPEDIEGLCARLKVKAGRYACWGRPAPATPSPKRGAETPLAFDIYLPAAAASDKPLRKVPTLGRAATRGRGGGKRARS